MSLRLWFIGLFLATAAAIGLSLFTGSTALAFGDVASGRFHAQFPRRTGSAWLFCLRGPWRGSRALF